MQVFTAADFADHEQVVFATDADTGLRMLIAVHSTALGPAIGGLRVMPYADEDAALTDVLRLSRGMSLKAAMARVPFGGGKMVVIADPHTDKSPGLLRAAGLAIERLGGRYVTGEDVGTTSADMAEIQKVTRHVMGMPVRAGGSGDPSPRTALGVFAGIEACVRERLDADDVAGLRVAVQGLGNVGWNLCRLLAEAGAELVVCDVRAERVRAATAELGASAVAPEEIYAERADVFAPCALGAVINDATLPALTASVVAGGANNQLASEARHGAMLHERGILYAPDYVINGGGMIQLAAERLGRLDWDEVNRQVRGIGTTLTEIFVRSRDSGEPPSRAATTIATERIAKASAAGTPG